MSRPVRTITSGKPLWATQIYNAGYSAGYRSGRNNNLVELQERVIERLKAELKLARDKINALERQNTTLSFHARRS